MTQVGTLPRVVARRDLEHELATAADRIAWAAKHLVSEKTPRRLVRPLAVYIGEIAEDVRVMTFLEEW